MKDQSSERAAHLGAFQHILQAWPEAGFISDHQLQILPLLRYEKSIELRRTYKYTLVLRIKFESLNEDSAFTERGKSRMIRKDHHKSFSLSLEGKLNSLEYTPKWPPGYGQAQWLVWQEVLIRSTFTRGGF